MRAKIESDILTLPGKEVSVGDAGSVSSEFGVIAKSPALSHVR
jgi:hypothetical protein